MTILALFAVGFTPNRILHGAKLQLVHPAVYTVGYFSIPYPNGDIPASQGVCTDVVIRSLRYAGYDLQRLIHEDMGKHFSAYPRRGKRPDPNIDHRRVPNQVAFMRRFGQALPLATTGAALTAWHGGDLVYWKLPSGLDHCGVVSDQIGPRGLPLVIHNIWQTAEEDVLDKYRIVGHFRYPKVQPASRASRSR